MLRASAATTSVLSGFSARATPVRAPGGAGSRGSRAPGLPAPEDPEDPRSYRSDDRHAFLEAAYGLLPLSGYLNTRCGRASHDDADTACGGPEKLTDVAPGSTGSSSGNSTVTNALPSRSP